MLFADRVFDIAFVKNWLAYMVEQLSELKTQVLIVDDQPLVREGLRTILSTSPQIEIAGEATNGSEGVEMAQRLKPDVVLMDIEMPGEMDGLAATRMLKTTCRECDVLMLTFHDGLEYLRQALRSGASGYILKDIDRAGLIEAVLTIANGGSLISPTMLRGLLEDFANTEFFFQNEARPRSVEQGLRYPIDSAALNLLTPREGQVLALMGEGLSNNTIAQRLTITQETVKSHVRKILEKLGVSDRTQAAVFAVKTGLTNR